MPVARAKRMACAIAGLLASCSTHNSCTVWGLERRGSSTAWAPPSQRLTLRGGCSSRSRRFISAFLVRRRNDHRKEIFRWSFFSPLDALWSVLNENALSVQLFPELIGKSEILGAPRLLALVD